VSSCSPILHQSGIGIATQIIAMGINLPSGVSIYLICLILFGAFAWYYTHDTVSCTVKGAGVTAVNGYYTAYDGTYLKRGHPIDHVPDFFEVIRLEKQVSTPVYSIGFMGNEWDIFTFPGQHATYANRPSHPERNIDRPPSTGWEGAGVGLGPIPPSEVSCQGDLSSSPNGNVSPTNNIELLVGRPTTTFLLLVNLLVAYILWANSVDVAAVSFSYDAVVNEGDYWRMVTASFSHFDLMHIGFNLMSLYQLGSLEFEYGSVAFMYLNIDLVFITMLICLGICYVRVKYYGHVDIQHQQSIGFSCVLFAWMVAASVRMDAYCPLFFMPSLCFNTMHLQVPFMGFTLPANLGPFVLLVVTKLVLPRTSLVGHFSGIVIGFPLAWNLLNWMTPPVLCVFLTFALVIVKDLWPWKLPGYSTSAADAREVLPATELALHDKIKLASTFFVLLSILGVYSDGLYAILPIIRIITAVFCYYAHHVTRCLWLSELRGTKQDCLSLVACASITTMVLLVCDVMSAVSVWTSRELLLYSGGLSSTTLIQGECFYISYIIVELYLLFIFMKALHITPEAKYYLRILLFDDVAVQKDIDSMLHVLPGCGGGEESDPFQGTGHQLSSAGGGASTSSSPRNSGSGGGGNIDL
jgi:membrane associated rhomboid family serine protease